MSCQVDVCKHVWPLNVKQQATSNTHPPARNCGHPLGTPQIGSSISPRVLEMYERTWKESVPPSACSRHSELGMTFTRMRTNCFISSCASTHRHNFCQSDAVLVWNGMSRDGLGWAGQHSPEAHVCLPAGGPFQESAQLVNAPRKGSRNVHATARLDTPAQLLLGRRIVNIQACLLPV